MYLIILELSTYTDRRETANMYYTSRGEYTYIFKINVCTYAKLKWACRRGFKSVPNICDRPWEKGPFAANNDF